MAPEQGRQKKNVEKNQLQPTAPGRGPFHRQRANEDVMTSRMRCGARPDDEGRVEQYRAGPVWDRLGGSFEQNKVAIQSSSHSLTHSRAPRFEWQKTPGKLKMRDVN